MKVETDITFEDYKAFLKFVHGRVSGAIKRSRSYSVASSILLIVVFGGFAALFVLKPEKRQELVWLIGGVAAGIVFMIVLMRFAARAQMKAMEPVEDGTTIGPRAVEVVEEGIRTWTKHSEGFYAWELVAAPETTATHVFIMVDRIAGLIVPKRSFSSEDECGRFVELVRAKALRLAPDH